MQITRFVVNMVSENCYLFWDEESKAAALVDCGAFYPEEQKAIADFIAENKLQLTHLFNTHGHFDHVFGASFVDKTYGVKIALCQDEQATYEHAAEQMSKFLHLNYPLSLPTAGSYFRDGDELCVGSIKLRVIATPGHTPGGVCFYCEEERVLFSGDSLFKHSIGRCDLPGGNESLLVNALKTRILTLPDDVKVLPGHGDMTTIAEEKRMNYYLQ